MGSLKRNMILMCILVVVLFGCNPVVHTQVNETHTPTAMEELKLDPAGDFFQWEEAIYKINIDWVDDVQVTKKDLLGEITTTYSKGEKFKDGMATKLPIGAKIYSTNERGNILLVEINGDLKKYLVLAEG
jgi:hypothetical protein